MEKETNINKKVIFFCISIIFTGILFPVSTQELPSRITVGTGSKALSMANNYVAVANDASAMFWNPAGLAFVPVREFQVSLNGYSRNSKTNVETGSGVLKDSISRQRVRVNNASLLRSIPTKRGGLSYAFGFQSPYLLDDNLKYIDTEKRVQYYTYGQINLWTASCGFQIAPNLGIGLSVSFLNGKNSIRIKKEYISPDSADIFAEIKQDYLGSDIRGGILYAPSGIIKVGMRFVLPQFIFFDESYYDNISGNEPLTGRLKNSASGALGISFMLPFMLIDIETHARCPIPEAEENTLFSYWKIGAGAGIEVPLFVKALFFRCGYSWQEVDMYPMMIDSKDIEDDVYADVNITPVKDEHFFTTGFSFLSKNGICFEIAYGFRFWELSSSTAPEASSPMTEKHYLHTVSSSLAVRY